jgi:methylglyoxal synthase
MATPMAVETLRSCEKSAGKKIKEACRLALDRLKAGPAGS